jgi:hypothetical protein
MLENKMDNKELNIPDKDENIIDIDIEGVKKQKFRINGGGIIELDVADINVITRLKEVYPKLNKLANEATANVDISSDTPVEKQLDSMSDFLKEIDKKMREYVDYIFDAPVSDVCVPYGSMYSPHNGKFRFEHVTETLGQLYVNKIDTEAKILSKRLREHTDKYVGKHNRRR